MENMRDRPRAWKKTQLRQERNGEACDSPLTRTRREDLGQRESDIKRIE